jgi:hypothetical protein
VIQFIFFRDFIDKVAVVLEAELDIVTNLQFHLSLALNHLLFVVKFSQVGVLCYFHHRGPFLGIKTQCFHQ